MAQRTSPKGRPRFRLVKHATKRALAIAANRIKRAAAVAAEKAARRERAIVARKERENGKAAAAAARRKLNLNVDGELNPPSPESVERAYCTRSNLIDNLRKTRKATRVDKLVLVPLRHRATAVEEEDDLAGKAIVVYGGGATTTTTPRTTYMPRWVTEMAVLERMPARSGCLVLGIDAATKAVYDELVLREETAIGDEELDDDDVPGGPEWDDRRREFRLKVDHFMENVKNIIGDREFSEWRGSVVNSVVGTFLTQNVKDGASSDAFMRVVAKFPQKKMRPENSDAHLLLTDVQDKEWHCQMPSSEPCSGCSESVAAEPLEQRNCPDKDFDALISSLQSGEISMWDEGDIKQVLIARFGNGSDKNFELSTAGKILKDIETIKATDTSNWKVLYEEACKNGYKKDDSIEDIDMVDWEALMNAPFCDFEDCIRDRGQHSQMAIRILIFLFRIKRDHGSIDLEWLRFVPRAKATYPNMAGIQTYLDPLMCNIPASTKYELHCQMITFGKIICSKGKPNCSACPFISECKYYRSQFIRAARALPEFSQQDAPNEAGMDMQRIYDLISKTSSGEMHQNQIENGQSTETHCSEPIIVIPPSPSPHCCEPITVIPSTPPPEYPGTGYDEDENMDHYVDMENIGLDIGMEDTILDIDMEIDLRPKKPSTNSSQIVPKYGQEIISFHPHAQSTRIQKKYSLRTEYIGYIVPDGHILLHKFEPRVRGDRNPYLLVIRSFDEQNVTATVLIPCRTANHGMFPLNGTYFQENEVFADHSSSRLPIQMSWEIVQSFYRCKVYFGTSIHSVTKGQTREELRDFYNEGYICTREFDLRTRSPKLLSTEIHATNVNRDIAKKRGRPDTVSEKPS
uniref:Demeter RRM-fold domain-containing protein n=1 Tax=Leersia perrieri TaxID=77586 RepID=A0A0D9W3U2_9ORYZ